MLKRIISLLSKKIMRKISDAPSINSNITYSGSYSNFSDLMLMCDIQDQYSTLEQFSASVEQAKVLLSSSKTDSFANIGWESQRLNFLPNFLASLNLDKLKALDIGGGFGRTYWNLKRSVPVEIQWDIIELDKTVRVGMEIFQDVKELSFFTLNSYLPSNYDLVYFGSSLQYFEDWQEIIELALNTHPKYILISDTTMGDIETFVCAQVNDSRTIIPRWVFNIKDLDILFSTFGYIRVLRTTNYYPFHNFYNYEGEYRNIEHSNLVFERKE